MNPLLVALTEKADALRASMNDILTRANTDGRDELTDTETKNFEDAETALKGLDERIRHLSDLELANAAAAELSAKVADATKDVKHTSPAVVRSEAHTYGEANPERSYFADVFAAKAGNDQGAWERLSRHGKENIVDRANTTISSVSEFVPPAYLLNDFADYVRASRPVANAIGSRQHPNTTTWYVPRVTQGTTIGYQASEFDTVSSQTIETDQIQVDSRTIGAYNDVSKQALDFAQGIQLDREIFGDLAKAYAVAVEDMVLNSTVANNLGILAVVGTNSVTYTDASATVAELYAKVAEAESAIHTNRLDAPNVIIMSPRRWSWIKSAADSTGRPLVAPYAGQNIPGLFGNGAPQGVVGEFYGLPVMVSHSVPLISEDATPVNQDSIIVAKLDDARLYESAMTTQVDMNSLSNKLGVRFVASAYLGFTAARYPKSFSIITGTGLNNPFA